MFVRVERGVRDEISLLVVVEPVQEERRRRIVTDGDEEAVRLDLPHLAGLGVPEPEAGHVAVALPEHLVDGCVQLELDLLVLARAVDHDRRRSELVSAMHDHDLAREARQEGRLLHGRVSSSDDRDHLVAEERAVARRAVGDATPLERLLGRQAELASTRPRRDDHRVGAVLVIADVYAERPLREVDAGDVVRDELRTEALGLSTEVGHHRRPHDAVGVARVVLDVARDHELAAPVEALDDQRAEICACGVEGGRVPGRTATDDDHVTNVAHEVSSDRG